MPQGGGNISFIPPEFFGLNGVASAIGSVAQGLEKRRREQEFQEDRLEAQTDRQTTRENVAEDREIAATGRADAKVQQAFNNALNARGAGATDQSVAGIEAGAGQLEFKTDPQDSLNNTLQGAIDYVQGGGDINTLDAMSRALLLRATHGSATGDLDRIAAELGLDATRLGLTGEALRQSQEEFSFGLARNAEDAANIALAGTPLAGGGTAGLQIARQKQEIEAAAHAATLQGFDTRIAAAQADAAEQGVAFDAENNPLVIERNRLARDAEITNNAFQERLLDEQLLASEARRKQVEAQLQASDPSLDSVRRERATQLSEFAPTVPPQAVIAYMDGNREGIPVEHLAALDASTAAISRIGQERLNGVIQDGLLKDKPSIKAITDMATLAESGMIEPDQILDLLAIEMNNLGYEAQVNQPGGILGFFGFGSSSLETNIGEVGLSPVQQLTAGIRTAAAEVQEVESIRQSIDPSVVISDLDQQLLSSAETLGMDVNDPELLQGTRQSIQRAHDASDATAEDRAFYGILLDEIDLRLPASEGGLGVASERAAARETEAAQTVELTPRLSIPTGMSESDLQQTYTNMEARFREARSNRRKPSVPGRTQASYRREASKIRADIVALDKYMRRRGITPTLVEVSVVPEPFAAEVEPELLLSEGDVDSIPTPAPPPELFEPQGGGFQPSPFSVR